MAETPQSPPANGQSVAGEVVMVYVTFPPEFDIVPLAEAALAAKLCACVNFTSMRSVYLWEGKVQNEPEQAAIFKTTPASEPALRQFIEQRHPYSVPCLATLQPALNPSFARFVADCTT